MSRCISLSCMRTDRPNFTIPIRRVSIHLRIVAGFRLSAAAACGTDNKFVLLSMTIYS